VLTFCLSGEVPPFSGDPSPYSSPRDRAMPPGSFDDRNPKAAPRDQVSGIELRPFDFAFVGSPAVDKMNVAWFGPWARRRRNEVFEAQRAAHGLSTIFTTIHIRNHSQKWNPL
jgi:hypothetical protein